MKKYKYFLSRICDIENVSAQELMELTGKSQAVVYSWRNLSKPECFPTIESLGKILFRLGLSFDDFINCRHPVYEEGDSARIYYRYICQVSAERRVISEELLELKNAEDVIKAYLDDRMFLQSMIDDYIAGLEIDKNRFDHLCKALMPLVISEIITDAEISICNLSSDTLHDYKLGLDCIKEMEEGNAEGGSCDKTDIPFHKIFFPDAEYVILLNAEKNIHLLENYLTIADETEKGSLLSCYVRICSENPNYDRKNRIIKLLMKNNCELVGAEDKETIQMYYDILKRVLNVC